MNYKMTIAIICITMMFFGSVAIVSDDSDATVPTITVDDADSLILAMKSTYTQQGNNLTFSPKNIVVAEGITSIELKSEHFSSWGSDYCGSPYFYGTIDGNGCTLITSFNSACNYLIGYVYGDSIIKNFDVRSDKSIFTFVYECRSLSEDNSTMTFEGITLSKYVTTGNNDSAFIIQVRDSDIVFRDCINNADYNMSTYSAIFIGGMVIGTVNASFQGCINNGNITGNHTYMFVGNDSVSEFGQSFTAQIDSNCKNNGSIAGMKVGLFSTHGGNNTTMNGLNSTYAERTDLTSNLRSIAPLVLETSYGEKNQIVINNTGNYSSFIVTMSAYATIENGGTYGISIELPAVAGPSGVFAGLFLDKNTASQKYGFDVSGNYTTTGSSFPYMIVDYDGFKAYIFDFGDTTNTWFLDATPRVSVSASNVGVFMGIMNLPVFTPGEITEKTTYKCKFIPNGAVVYEILSEGGAVVVDGGSIRFTVTPNPGFRITSVTANNDVLSSEGNEYTYRPSSDFEVEVTTELVAYPVSYDLNNVIISNNPETVEFGEGFNATITAKDGYRITFVNVMMGGEDVILSGNIINIPVVNGAISIIAIASQIIDESEPSIPSDDDELPFIPPQSGGDNGADTTTYVAVAAAAAVVAILAVLAVGISKGKL